MIEYISAALLFLVVVTVLTGIYWWIPTYVPADKQDTATHWMLVSASAAVLIINIITTFNALNIGMQGVGLATQLASGGKRK